MKFVVFESKLDEVTKRLNALSRKAEKAGCGFSYEIGEAHPEKVTVWAHDDINHVQFYAGDYMVSAVDITVSEDLIRHSGWDVVAKIEHFDNGNLVSMFDRSDTPAEWRTVKANCVHCGINRLRSVTFMVRNEDGEIRQVGSACLKEYTGINPALAVAWASVCDCLAENEVRECYGEFDVSRSLVSVKDVLAYAYDEVKAHGYRSVDGPNCTADMVRKAMREGKASDEGLKVAQDIMDWMNGCDPEERDAKGYLKVPTFVADCIVLTKQGWAKRDHINRLAYLPVAWRKELERREKERQWEETHKAEMASGYVGEVGKRSVFAVNGGVCVTSFENQWGITNLYKFTDADGNVLIWYASSAIQNPENVREIKATVKAHNEYNGVRQTVLTRCTVVRTESKRSA